MKELDNEIVELANKGSYKKSIKKVKEVLALF